MLDESLPQRVIDMVSGLTPPDKNRDFKELDERVNDLRDTVRFKGVATNVSDVNFGVGSGSSETPPIQGLFALTPSIHNTGIILSYTGATGVLAGGDIIDTDENAWQGELLEITDGTEIAGTLFAELVNSTLFNEDPQTLNVSATWTGAIYTTSSVIFNALFVKTSSVLVDDINGDPTVGYLFGRIMDGKLLLMKPINGKTLTLTSGGNIDIGSDVVVQDDSFVILQFHKDNINADAVGSYSVLGSTSGGSGGSSGVWKAPCRLATTANITLSGEQSIDGVTSSTDRILVKNQTTGSENGVYVSASGAWVRATDFDDDAEVSSGIHIYIEEGDTQQFAVYKLTTVNPITIGTTPLTFQTIIVMAGGVMINVGTIGFNPANNMTLTSPDDVTLELEVPDTGAFDFYVDRPNTTIPRFGITETQIEMNVPLDMNGKSIGSSLPPATEIFKIFFDQNDDSDTYFGNSTVGADRINVTTDNINIWAFERGAIASLSQAGLINNAGEKMQLNVADHWLYFADTAVPDDPVNNSEMRMFMDSADDILKVRKRDSVGALTTVSLESGVVPDGTADFQHLEWESSVWNARDDITLANNKAINFRTLFPDNAGLKLDINDEFVWFRGTGTSNMFFDTMDLTGIGSLATQDGYGTPRPSTGFLRMANAVQQVWKNSSGSNDAIFEFDSNNDFVWQINALPILTLEEGAGVGLINAKQHTIKNIRKLLNHGGTDNDIGEAGATLGWDQIFVDKWRFEEQESPNRTEMSMGSDTNRIWVNVDDSTGTFEITFNDGVIADTRHEFQDNQYKLYNSSNNIFTLLNNGDLETRFLNDVSEEFYFSGANHTRFRLIGTGFTNVALNNDEILFDSSNQTANDIVGQMHFVGHTDTAVNFDIAKIVAKNEVPTLATRSGLLEFRLSQSGTENDLFIDLTGFFNKINFRKVLNMNNNKIDDIGETTITDLTTAVGASGDFLMMVDATDGLMKKVNAVDFIGGGSQTPWTSQINASNNSLINFDYLARNGTPATIGAIRLEFGNDIAWRNSSNTNDNIIDFSTGNTFRIGHDGIVSYSFSATDFDLNGQNMIDVKNITFRDGLGVLNMNLSNITNVDLMTFGAGGGTNAITGLDLFTMKDSGSILNMNAGRLNMAGGDIQNVDDIFMQNASSSIVMSNGNITGIDNIIFNGGLSFLSGLDTLTMLDSGAVINMNNGNIINMGDITMNGLTSSINMNSGDITNGDDCTFDAFITTDRFRSNSSSSECGFFVRAETGSIGGFGTVQIPVDTGGESTTAQANSDFGAYDGAIGLYERNGSDPFVCVRSNGVWYGLIFGLNI